MRFRRRRLALAAMAYCLARVLSAGAVEHAEWRPLAIVRFGNIDAIDAEDGELAGFIKSIRNDGRFIPPMRTLIGPEIRNPTFFGLVYEAWFECVLMIPTRPGPVAALWVFPVDNRDEYLSHLSNQGLAEYEGMDGVTVLRETDRDGNIRTWHLEWLPGNVAILGTNRSAVTSGRLLYAENSAARGLLFRVGGQFLEPDVIVRVDPRHLAAWQDREPGLYWWRERVDRLTRDLLEHWDVAAARARLVYGLSDLVAAFPLLLERVDLSLWFEPTGIEWRLEVAGDFSSVSARSELDVLRRFPDRTAMAYAMPVTRLSVNRLGSTAGALILGGAGGVVNREARDVAAALFSLLVDASPTQMAAGWIPPPVGRPELGGARMLVVEWENPEAIEDAWQLALRAMAPGNPATQVFSQLGWEVDARVDSRVPGSANIRIAPAGGQGADPYYHAAVAYRRNGSTGALVVGASRLDADARDTVLEYRAEMARTAVASPAEGGPDIRTAFTRMGSRGASFLGLIEPVRLLQFALVERGDWRPRSPDQPEPASSRMAREMLEYGSGRAWSAAGEAEPGMWRFTGGISWQSLARISAALGITESIGME